MVVEERPTILIVDDDDAARLILGQIFESKYDLFEAVNGEFALEIIRKKGIYPDLVILDINMPVLDGFTVLEDLMSSPEFRRIPVIVSTADTDNATRRKAYSLGAVDVFTKPFQPDTIRFRVSNILASISANKKYAASVIRDQFISYETSDVTGLWNRQRFIDMVALYLKDHPDEKLLISRWDIDQFKLFNDTYGTSAGDSLLHEIGVRYSKNNETFGEAGPIFFAHWGADHFIALYRESHFNPETIYRYTLSQLQAIVPDAHISIGFGFYKIEDRNMSVAVMCDRAGLARRSIKDQYGVHYAWYHESMRSQLVAEQALIAAMKPALLNHEFVPYFQPQYNYETQSIIGAEALIRWKSADGLVSPGKFIPLFERNGFITEVDYYMWDETCRLISTWRDKGYNVPPISVNISRRDLYAPDLADYICGLIDKYELTPSCLHLEITESAYMDNPDQLLSVIECLRSKGFHLEMDDFGSGYSSLNTLKDVPVDMLKLDMKFVAESANNSRGGSILSSVVHMAHGINLPVIAEGVETRQQADYLKTINCLYMQGYLFAKPMPAEEFELLLSKQSGEGAANIQFTNAVDNSADFLDGSTQATLLFNSFVGGAAIVEFENDNLSVLRMNDRFYEELRMVRSVFNSHTTDFMNYLESGAQRVLIDTTKLAISSNAETSCELHCPSIKRHVSEQWLLLRFRYLASKFNSHILYASVSNISSRKLLEKALYKEKFAMDQILRFAPGGIAEFVADGDDSLTRIFLSEAANEILGYTAGSELPTTSLMSQLRRVVPEDRKNVRETIQRAMADKTNFSVDFRIKLANTAIRWVNLTANPAVIDDELHYFGIYTDISRHKAIEENQMLGFLNNRLNETVKETIIYRAWIKYLEGTPAFVFIKDINLMYISASDSFAKVIGHNTADDVIGKSAFDVFEDQNAAAAFSKMDLEILSTGQSKINFVEKAADVDGQEKLLLTSKLVLRNSSNDVIGLLGIARFVDSTEKAAEEYSLALDNTSSKHVFRYMVKSKSFLDVENDDNVLSPIRIANGPEKTVQSGSIDIESVEAWNNLFKAIDSGREIGYSDILFREKNGDYTWYRVSYKTIFDDDGQPASAIITYKNVNHFLKNGYTNTLQQVYSYDALTTLYPICAISNLTYNQVRVMKSLGPDYPLGIPVHTYDEALDNVLKFCASKDKKRMSAALDRTTIIKKFSEGERIVSYFADMVFSDYQPHHVECMAIKVDDPVGKDVLATLLVREIS